MYNIAVGEKRSLVFPVMCNAHVKLPYSGNIPDTDSNSVTSDDIAYGLWAHEGTFTFESIITPYDINGYGKVSAGGSIPSFTPSKKIMPSSHHLDARPLGNPNDYESNLYLPFAQRLTHEMKIFHNTNFSISLLNSTLLNENQPAEYKIKVDLTIDGTTETFTTNTAISPNIEYYHSFESNQPQVNNLGFNQYRYIGVSIIGNHSAGATTINTFINLYAAGQELFVFDTTNGYRSIGTIASVGGSNITLSSGLPFDVASTSKVYIQGYANPSYINNLYHVAFTLNDNNNAINIFLNGRLLLSSEHTKKTTFSFDRTDIFLGAKGLTDTTATPPVGTVAGSAITNNQFMGEFHELSIIDIPKLKFPFVNTLLPSLDETLLYLRFEEIDL
tara:strand:- start:13715 stop:14878 length:1164 start_codon:yes stop_codon:yes gene_type:complete